MPASLVTVGPRATTDYTPLDDALVELAASGPDLRNGMTSHAPMAVEALCALGRGDAVPAWLARYRAELLPWPAPRAPIAADAWRDALAVEARVSDWRALFAAELAGAPWRAVLDRWVARLAPGFCAAAAHGVIRVGHAVRALAAGENAGRVRELGDGLASWAATYQTLPTATDGRSRGLSLATALTRVPRLSPTQRRFAGTITSALAALDQLPAFAPVIDLPDWSGDPTATAAALSELFARLYLANANSVLGSIVFVHAVTGVAAVEHLLPHVSEATGRRALRFAWQTGCALYAAFGEQPPAPVAAAPRDGIDPIARAVAHGDGHVIKLTDACLAHASAAHLAAAAHVADTLPAASAS
ncbi:MAG: questin oxidase family protein [Deltaproteobacteria bacterium]|nr:questin oxidase family protein [Deltaproteobacteria bacterium]